MNNCTECPFFFLVSALLSDQVDHSIEPIKKAISIQTGVSVRKLESKSRKQHIVRARNIAMKRCRGLGITLKRIGDAFNRSHSTVMHSISHQQSINR